MMKSLLLAGGRGTRMKPLTHTSNKHAIPIANKPLILYPFEMIVKSGIKEIGVIVNETKDEIEEILGNGKDWGVKITYIFQDKPKGLAHALSLSEEFMGDSKFVMVLGDNILEKGINQYVEEFEKNNNFNAGLLGVKVPEKDHKRYGMATIGKDEKVLRYIEKPGIVDNSKLYNPKKSYAVSGFYFFDKNVFKCFKGKGKIQPSIRGEYEISAPFNWLIENGFQVKFNEVNGWYKDPGNPEDTLITNQVILSTLLKPVISGKIDTKSIIEGKVELQKGSKVINSRIRGPVSIGKNCIIENCYIGPYTSVYDNSILKNCEIENSIIMGNVKIIDTKKRFDSCLVGWNAEVTTNSLISDTSSLFIGDDSVVRL